MRIPVTGGAGFVLSHPCDHLLEHGHDVRVRESSIGPVHAVGERPACLQDDVERLMRTSGERTVALASVAAGR